MSNRTYQNITAVEMSAFLISRKFQQITLPGVNEIVWAKIVPHPTRKLSLRVYTGIKLADGQSRDVGADAIRATLFEKSGDQIVMARGTLAVRRTGTWRQNLDERILDLEANPGERVTCPKCSALMSVRDSKHGKFYGCSRYPQCDGKRPVS